MGLRAGDSKSALLRSSCAVTCAGPKSKGMHWIGRGMGPTLRSWLSVFGPASRPLWVFARACLCCLRDGRVRLVCTPRVAANDAATGWGLPEVCGLVLGSLDTGGVHRGCMGQSGCMCASETVGGTASAPADVACITGQVALVASCAAGLRALANVSKYPGVACWSGCCL